jgi:hypothetical protein
MVMRVIRIRTPLALEVFQGLEGLDEDVLGDAVGLGGVAERVGAGKCASGAI